MEVSENISLDKYLFKVLSDKVDSYNLTFKLEILKNIVFDYKIVVAEEVEFVSVIHVDESSSGRSKLRVSLEIIVFYYHFCVAES